MWKSTSASCLLSTRCNGCKDLGERGGRGGHRAVGKQELCEGGWVGDFSGGKGFCPRKSTMKHHTARSEQNDGDDALASRPFGL